MELYFNNASTTQPDESVIADFIYCAKTYWHNPSDVSQGGLAAKEIIENAQKQIAASINAEPKEIIFTSGGSESNNWAIKGYSDHEFVDLIITTKIEHPSVYNTCKFMKEYGTHIEYVPVDHFGKVMPFELVKILDRNVHTNNYRFMVSIMFANNEIGTIQPIKEIANIVHKYGGVLHVDAVQAYMHHPIDVKELGIDMMSTSFHKFGGFKNCGFLYVRDGIELTPLIHGGHQFDSKRSGTENVPMIYAMGNQVEKLHKTVKDRCSYLEDAAYYFLRELHERSKDLCNIYMNGHPLDRMFNNMNFTIDGISADLLIDMMEEKGIYISAGSACCAGEKTPSRVLKSIGLSDKEAFSTVRISMEDYVTTEDINYVVEALVQCIRTIKEYEIE